MDLDRGGIHDTTTPQGGGMDVDDDLEVGDVDTFLHMKYKNHGGYVSSNCRVQCS